VTSLLFDLSTNPTFTYFTMGNTYSQTFPPKPRWDTEDIPDLTGYTALVTGGYTGIGKWTAKVPIVETAFFYAC
jgi:retinol dehydrogenase-12